MGIEYTREQRMVIDLRGRDLLVSAAAGSGKTAVLVERICQLILDKEHPMDVDQLLVVTFTNAAAAEMKKRIMLSLQKQLEVDPSNQHLQKQVTLIHNANISTIDGFCLRMLKEYFYLLDLEPGFRILDENEGALIREDVMNQVITSFYEEANQSFIDFVESYEEGKTDEGLKEYIEKVYRTASANPWPEKWIDACMDCYDAEKIEKPEDISLLTLALKDCRLRIEDCVSLLQRASKECGEYKALEKLSIDLYERSVELKAILDKPDYDSMYQIIADYKFPNMPRCSKLDAVTEEVKDAAKAARDQAKATLSDLKKSCFTADGKTVVKEHLDMAPKVFILCEMTKAFMNAFAKEKRRRNVVDFSDVEHMVLDLLYKEDGSFSKVAMECRNQFREIMIDEYQDSNQLQEAILYAISKNPEGGHNLFMVGDVKQSIYRFRQAEPGLFLEKYRTYTLEDSPSQKINLDCNFRSRKEVLRFSNLIFDGLMQEEFGGISYDEHAALKYGASFDTSREEAFSTKVLIADEDAIKEQSQDKNKELHEGYMIGQEIQKIMEEGLVFDSSTQQYRKPKYSDIVILLRGKKLSVPIVDALKAFQIPAIAIEKTGYFKTTEIALVLSVLRLIDNERQDIPLAAALSSPIGKLSKRELAVIKAAHKEESFYEAVLAYKEEGEEEIIKEKLGRFYELLYGLKNLSYVLAVHELIKELYKRSGYYEYVKVMVDGEVRKQNLDILVERAKDYEKTSYHGLFQFLRYVDKMQKYDLDFSEGSGQQAINAVHLMTIHKSKGLEFPIVFVSGLGKQFNTSDIKEALIADANYKIAMKYTDPARRIKSDSVTHEAMKTLIKKDNLSEEIRVLYVALTRAKERLILTGAVGKLDKLLKDAEKMINENGRLTYSARLKASNFYQWILPLLYGNMAHTRADFCVEVMDNLTVPDMELSPEKVDENRLQEIMMHPLSSEEGQKKLATMFASAYHHQGEVALKGKMSVSEIKHKFMEYSFETEEEEERPEFLKEERKETIPVFMGAVDEVNMGALRGTAMHRVLECFDFTREEFMTPSIEVIQTQLEELFQNGLISEEQKKLVSLKGLLAFFESRVGKEVLLASREKKLVKEQPFVMGILPREAGIEMDSEDRILVQGIIDVFYETNDGLVLLDYKTDAVKSAEELIKRYKKQMELYKDAIERIYEKKVCNVYLYSFALKEVIDVP